MVQARTVNPPRMSSTLTYHPKAHRIMKLYIAVLDIFPDYMVPTLVAHSVLAAHIKFADNFFYHDWLVNSFKKCVLRVNEKEFYKIATLDDVHLGHETNTLDGRSACAVICPRKEYPNVLKFAKLWKPNGTTTCSTDSNGV